MPAVVDVMILNLLSLLFNFITVIFVIIGWRLSYKAYMYPKRTDVILELCNTLTVLRTYSDWRVFDPVKDDVESIFCRFVNAEKISRVVLDAEIRRVEQLRLRIVSLWPRYIVNGACDYCDDYLGWLRLIRIGFYGASEEHPDVHLFSGHDYMLKHLIDESRLSSIIKALEKTTRY